MSDKKTLAITLLKVLMLLLFPVCLFFSLRWSSQPMLNLPNFLKILFLQPQNVDPSMLNLVTGYVSGYIVYLLTVVIPTFLKNRPMQLEAAKRLSSLYRKNMMVLLLMCKNACTKEEWSTVLRNSDFASFNEDYYERMRFFDIKADADTLYLHKENLTPLAWHEYLEFICEETKKGLDEIFLQFHAYLSDDMLKIITDMRNNAFIGIFTDCTVGTDYESTGKDGYLYFDSMTASAFFAQDGEQGPIFSKSEGVDNADILRDYILILQYLYKILKQFPKGIAVKDNYVVDRLRADNAGHYHTAVFSL